MPAVRIDGLEFDFPSSWNASKYDDWEFYRKKFAVMWNGIKAIDLLAVDPDRTAWLVEVKDYRAHERTKPSELDDEIARKVFDTLAAMLPAKLNASDGQEATMAASVLGAKRLRVVLHLEQPRVHRSQRASPPCAPGPEPGGALRGGGHQYGLPAARREGEDERRGRGAGPARRRARRRAERSAAPRRPAGGDAWEAAQVAGYAAAFAVDSGTPCPKAPNSSAKEGPRQRRRQLVPAPLPNFRTLQR